MRTKALYFPYINIPNGNWLNLMLLYWDQLSSIMPSDYIYNPEALSPHMPILMREGLINPIFPMNIFNNSLNFNELFINDIKKQQDRKLRYKYLANDKKTRIHIEKLGSVADELVKMHLATSLDYPWYEMDQWVANTFMSHLVSFIGKLPEIDSIPITNDQACFDIFARIERPTVNEQTIQRQIILEKLLPLPIGNVNIDNIITFKAKYNSELIRFRNTIESKCIELSNINDSVDRENQRDLIISEFKEQIDSIYNHMKETWHQVLLLPIFLFSTGATVISLYNNQELAATLGTVTSGTVTLLSSCIKQSKENKLYLKQPLAYGAFFRRQSWD